MTHKLAADFASEWQTLHHSHEKYEHFALLIKLFAVALTLIAFMFTLSTLLILSLLAVLWLQEGIWKTFQARASERIEYIEQALCKQQTSEHQAFAFQFYSQWTDNRPATRALMTSYINNALKPTVIYPYLPLMLVVLFS
ncbi:MAG: hypothetical protein OQK09_06170 [Colwellia sp.]|nr:hypothetical protein [Colwellia sp.]MCW8864362.1 hypothetical protein [Colwellia sp.]MCW9081081.1 hypothetical protein [Colwellia sp.]